MRVSVVPYHGLSAPVLLLAMASLPGAVTLCRPADVTLRGICFWWLVFMLSFMPVCSTAVLSPPNRSLWTWAGEGQPCWTDRVYSLPWPSFYCIHLLQCHFLFVWVFFSLKQNFQSPVYLLINKQLSCVSVLCVNMKIPCLCWTWVITKVCVIGT